MRSSIALTLPFISLLLACRPPAATLSSTLEKDGEPPLRPFDLGTYHRAVSTRSADAQRAFDQGLIWAYAFNHDEAKRAFHVAARADSGLAMAYWGFALVNGPHINNTSMNSVQSREAYFALKKAQAAAASATPVEQALIEALTARYAWPPPADRRPLDLAYAQAMSQVYTRFPEDADVAALYAEAMLDLRPWDQWTKDGKPQPGTEEVLRALETALRLSPDHPGALHLSIHALEASPEPGRAAAAADRLRSLVPDASHLVHMPAHIDVRLGHWQRAAAANEAAIAADQRYRSHRPKLGQYRLYMAHNQHFLAYTAMMEGRSAIALQTAWQVVAGLPPKWVKENAALADPFLTVHWEAQKRFGKWQELLEAPEPGPRLPVATAYRHFLRGVAYAALEKAAAAEHERAAFLEALPKVPRESKWGANAAASVLAVAVPYLEGEIAFQRGQKDQSVARLREAVRLADALLYDEPPAWQVPPRHALGAVLLAEQRFAEALAVYEEDLLRYPDNGWSLYGLSQALQGLKRTAEAEAALHRFQQAWSRADMEIASSCLCVGKQRADRSTLAKPGSIPLPTQGALAP